MSFVLVDAPSVTATLVAAGEPRPVQIVILGVSTGQSVTVTSLAGGVEASVPGGTIASAPGGQIVLVDNRAPLNTPVVYQVVIDGVVYLSNEVTVTFDASIVMQSLDGQTVAKFWWLEDGLPRSYAVRSSTFDVPGRRRPPVRFAPGGAGGGSLTARTAQEDTASIEDLLDAGRPIVLRTDGSFRDLPPSEIALITDASNVLSRTAAIDARRTERVWSIGYLLVDDPEPGTALSAFTWDDFDLAMTGRTWADFDAIFAAETWDDFDAYDWSQLL